MISNNLLCVLVSYWSRAFLSTCGDVRIVIFSFFIGFIKHQPSFQDREGATNFLVIQPNIYESLVNYDVIENIEKYEQLTLEALQARPDADVIIWPEGSLPIDLNNRPGLLQRLGSILRNNQKLILGSWALEYDVLVYNRLYVLNELGVIEL